MSETRLARILAAIARLFRRSISPEPYRSDSVALIASINGPSFGVLLRYRPLRQTCAFGQGFVLTTPLCRRSVRRRKGWSPAVRLPIFRGGSLTTFAIRPRGTFGATPTARSRLAYRPRPCTRTRARPEADHVTSIFLLLSILCLEWLLVTVHENRGKQCNYGYFT
jgi:hypothetical protein